MTCSTHRYRGRLSDRPPRSLGLPSLAVGLLSLTLALPAVAQEGDSPPPPNEPAWWKSAAIGAAAIGTLFLLDEPVRDLARDLRGELGDDLASVGDDYGSWATTAPWLMGSGLLLGAALEGSVGTRRAAAAAVGLLSAAVVNESLNRALGRRRPNEEVGAWRFDPFHGHASLGSGHAAYTFAIAGAIDQVTEGWVAIPFYAAAAGSGLSRIYHDRHWLSDVAVGSLIGWWVGTRATRSASQRFGVARTPGGSPPGETTRSLLRRLEPVVSLSFVGLRLKA